MPYRDRERKLAYDRARMARLYAEGKTWWQQRPDARWRYDAIERGSSSTYYWVRRTRSKMGALAGAAEYLGARLGKTAQETLAEHGLDGRDWLPKFVQKHKRHLAENEDRRRLKRQVAREIELVGNPSTWRRLDMALMKEELRG